MWREVVLFWSLTKCELRCARSKIMAYANDISSKANVSIPTGCETVHGEREEVFAPSDPDSDPL